MEPLHWQPAAQNRLSVPDPLSPVDLKVPGSQRHYR